MEHVHAGPACDPMVCPADRQCAGMTRLIYCIPQPGFGGLVTGLYLCVHLDAGLGVNDRTRTEIIKTES
jgi:hypothetical protein